MLGNFIYSNPTNIYFGDNIQKNLVKALSGIGKKVMLTYGGGSIKRNGTYEDMLDGIADETIILTGGYETLNHDEIVEILRKSL